MRRLSVVLLVAVAVAGCKKSNPPAVAPQAAPAVAADAGGNALTGTVLERLDAPPYSYLRLKTAQGEVWAAVPKTDAANGAQVTVAGAMPMNDFESKTLKRKFDLVYFGTIGGPAAAGGAAPSGMGGGAMGGGAMGGGAMGGGMAPEPPAQMAAQHAAAASGPTDVGNVKVEKAKGADARTVAEIWAQKVALKDRPVTIRGKVVKFNENIMGKNWVHLRDGSGTAGKDNDLTVTTSDKVAVGDVVTAKGTVHVDKDFGAGYAYPVIVEDAKMAK